MLGRALVIAVALLALAGCIQKDAPPTPASTSSAAAEPAAASAPLHPPRPPTREAALDFHGSVPAFAGACAFAFVTGACVDAPPFDYAKLRTTLRQPDITGFVVNVTWDAASPFTTQLTVFAFAQLGENVTQLGARTGPSPLVWRVDEADVPDGAMLVLGATAPSSGFFFVNAVANPVEQPFRMTGSVTSSS